MAFWDNRDIVQEICNNANTKSAIQVLSITQSMHEMKKKIIFGGLQKLSVIQYLPYFNQFTKVVIDIDIPLPNFARYAKFNFKTGHHTLLDIPQDTTDLCFGGKFNEIIMSYPDRPKIRRIYFGLSYNQPLCKIPDNVRIIVFLKDFNQSLVGILPKNLIKITLSSNFNQPIHDTFQNGIRRIDFGSKFNQPIKTHIPDTVRKLSFGHDFDQDIDGLLPKEIRVLRLGVNFNRNIDLTSLQNIRIIIFSYKYRQPIKNKFPSSIKQIYFSQYFNQPINDMFPNGIRIVFFGNHFNQTIQGHIPDTIRTLNFGMNFHQPLDEIPFGVTHLTLHNINNIKCIPTSVTHLTLCEIDRSIPIPCSVTHLSFRRFNESVVGYIPPNVKFIDFGCKFNQPFEDNVPHTVTKIYIGRKYELPISDEFKTRVVVKFGINNLYYTLLIAACNTKSLVNIYVITMNTNNFTISITLSVEARISWRITTKSFSY